MSTNINQNIKLHREIKKISQEYMSYELGISQSQYSRRECGSMKFTLEETVKISKILTLPLSSLIETDSEPSKSTTNLTITEQLINQYEARLKEKDELISILKSINNLD